MITTCLKCNKSVAGRCLSCFPVDRTCLDMSKVVSHYDHKFISVVFDRLHGAREFNKTYSVKELFNQISNFSTVDCVGIKAKDRATVIGMLAARIFTQEATKYEARKN